MVGARLRMMASSWSFGYTSSLGDSIFGVRGSVIYS